MSRGKTRVTERDVRLFARSHGLPEDYAASFYASMQKSAEHGQTKGIPFQTFDRFVNSREEALHRTFDILDARAQLTAWLLLSEHLSGCGKCDSGLRCC